MQTLKDVMRIPTLYITTDEVSELIESPSVHSLADYLPTDESVIDLTKGIHNDEIGTLAVTNKRVIFVDEATIRTKLIDIEFKDIAAAVAVHKLFLRSLLVQYRDGTFIVGKISRKHAKRIARHIDAAAIHFKEEFITKAK